MSFICEGCEKKMEAMKVASIGPGTLTWCESCLDKADEKSAELNRKFHSGELTIHEVLEQSKGRRSNQKEKE